MAAETEVVAADMCIGRISAEVKYCCPPGYPILIYGEQIQKQHLAYMTPGQGLKVGKEEETNLLIKLSNSSLDGAEDKQSPTS